MKLSPTGRSALAYAERYSWHVGPTLPGTKLPHPRFLRHGHLEATNDTKQLSIWYTVAPDAGVLVSCAASGLVVIDRDTYKPDCAFGELEARLGPLPETPRVVTQRGGEHYYFRDTVGAGYCNPCAGVEAKHQGYVLAPATPGYRWDVGAHVLDTELAELPDAWLDALTSKPKAAALPSSGTDAADSWLGRAFEVMGWLGDPLLDGRRAVRCPWLHEHTDGRGDGRDSSTIIFPRATDRTLGGFRCAHSHCAGRTWRDVVEAVPAKAKWAADHAMRKERNRIALSQLASARRTA